LRDTVNGREVEITISRTDPMRAILTPISGDFFVIRLDGIIISFGRVTSVATNGNITFTPSPNSPGPQTPFTGTIDSGGALGIPNIPYEGGNISGVSATTDSGGGGASSGGGGGGGGSTSTVQQLSATAANFDEVIKSIRMIPGNYVITLTEDLINYEGIWLGTAGVHITIRGDITSRRISWRHAETNGINLFHVAGGRLILENISLGRGTGNTNQWPLLQVNGGTLEMRSGVTVNNAINTNTDGYFNAVELQGNNSTFIMSGGIIENCYVGVDVHTSAVRASVTISGGIIRNNASHGARLREGSTNSTLLISGGEIRGNGNVEYGNGICIRGTDNSVTISGGTISANVHNGVLMHNDGARNTANISGTTTISGNGRNGVVLVGSNNRFNMSGGTISGNVHHGVALDGSNNRFNMSGGTISGNVHHGVLIHPDGASNTINITGGTISGNTYSGVLLRSNGGTHTISNVTISGNSHSGVSIEGDNKIVNISGASILNNTQQGVSIWQGSANTVNLSAMTISGHLSSTPGSRSAGVSVGGPNNIINILSGDISGNFWGLHVYDSGNTFNMSGGTIRNTDHFAVNLYHPDSTFIMSGGSISGSARFGLIVSGANTRFEKQAGAIIYGNNAGANSNAEGAILVWSDTLGPPPGTGLLQLLNNAESNVVYAARINAAEDGIAPGTQQPATWP
jgi:hypothetical protein